MRIRWTVPAADDLENIKNYLQQNYPQFAESTVRAIYQRIRLLKTSPNPGRPGHRSGTKELALTPLPYARVSHPPLNHDLVEHPVEREHEPAQGNEHGTEASRVENKRP